MSQSLRNVSFCLPILIIVTPIHFYQHKCSPAKEQKTRPTLQIWNEKGNWYTKSQNDWANWLRNYSIWMRSHHWIAYLPIHVGFHSVVFHRRRCRLRCCYWCCFGAIFIFHPWNGKQMKMTVNLYADARITTSQSWRFINYVNDFSSEYKWALKWLIGFSVCRQRVSL